LYPELGYVAEDEERWWRFDPRLEWLIDTLKLLRQHKVLVICAHAETALDLEEALRLRSGIPATVFHEGMSILERDRAAAYFADGEFGADVPIMSQSGSVARHCQFAQRRPLIARRALPHTLGHRNTRRDRSGQTHRVQLRVPCRTDSAQAPSYKW